MREKRKTIITTAKKMRKNNTIPQRILDAFFHVILCEMDSTWNPVKETKGTHLKTAI